MATWTLRGTTIRKLWYILPRESRLKLPILYGLTLVSSAFEVIGIGLLIPVMTTISKGGDGGSASILQPVFEFFGVESQVSMIRLAVVLLLAAFLVKNAFLLWSQMYTARVGQQMTRAVGTRLFRSYIHRPYTYHLQRNSAELIHGVLQEAQAALGVSLSFVNLSREVVVGLGLAILMVLTESLAALTTFVLLFGGVLAYSRVTKRTARSLGRARRKVAPQVVQHLQQGFGGVKDIHVLGRASDFAEGYARHRARLDAIDIRSGALKQIGPRWIETLALGGLIVVIWTVVAGERDADRVLPLLAVFAAATWRFIPTTNTIINMFNSLRLSGPAIDAVYEELRHIEAEERIVRTRTDFTRELALRGVTYTYPNAARPSLEHVDVAVRAGETVGFIGPSGAGKSSLVDVVLGLLPPDSGQVLVDGRDLHAERLAWHATIGYVPQAIYLTDDTIRRNVAFGIADKAVDDAAVERALRSAQLWDFVASLPKGIHTIVGERGIRLSGGQRQRVGIARALYHDPKVLILDEATSNLDTETETEVMSAIRALRGAKTILIVAHRLTTVAHCDRVYRLEHARVVGEGSLEALAASR
jgi:ABC-type multidrug transport system fused ATPase/permease subunit